VPGGKEDRSSANKIHHIFARGVAGANRGRGKREKGGKENSFMKEKDPKPCPEKIKDLLTFIGRPDCLWRKEKRGGTLSKKGGRESKILRA